MFLRSARARQKSAVQRAGARSAGQAHVAVYEMRGQFGVGARGARFCAPTPARQARVLSGRRFGMSASERRGAAHVTIWSAVTTPSLFASSAEIKKPRGGASSSGSSSIARSSLSSSAPSLEEVGGAMGPQKPQNGFKLWSH